MKNIFKKKSVLMVLIIVQIIMLVSCQSKNSGTFKVVDGKEYFFNKDEQVVDKLVTYSGENYFIKDDGTKAKNEWIQIENDGSWWAYFGARGIMVKNSIWEIDNQLYAFDENGRLKMDGLIEFNDKQFFASKEGCLLQKQLKTIGNKVYYFGDNGSRIDVATKSWVENINLNGSSDFKTGWYVLDVDNSIVKSSWYDGYYLEDDGLMAIDKWIGDGEDRVYVGTDGKRQTDYKEVKKFLSDILGNSSKNENDSVNELAVWQLKYYVDDFGEYTDEKYLRGDFTGQFSNSVTTNSKCDFVFLVENQVYIVLYEYGNINVKNYGNIETMYNITLKTSSGSQVTFVGTMSDDRIKIDTYGSKYIINSLKNGETFKLLIEENTSYNSYLTPSKYLVEVKASNFNYLYWQ